jgi:ATP-dependent DNA helicase RecQ
MLKKLSSILKQYWGYDGFLPLQKDSMESVLMEKDSIVVLPTGGGKSLCYQAPAMLMPGTAIIVSPLISLMKDQVDALEEWGVPSARIDSSLSPGEKNRIQRKIVEGKIKLLYLSPERLMMENVPAYLRQLRISFIAVDEAHCISMWGHDFRPEYRELGKLKEAFPGIAIHAFTATATRQVRDDIAEQLRLQNPTILVGSFDRPNLVYKTERRTDETKQICAILERHKGESGIIYCIRRVDVEETCEKLVALGYKAAPYHAGMEDEERKRNQEAFINEKVDIIVATIAFGMGIDKSNVRYVIHSGMPKSLEHYQQESGRAGRDGLEADCVMLFSGGDYGIWKSLMRNMDPQIQKIALSKLNAMYEYCSGIGCRHKFILNYFGQNHEKENCYACDVCLGNLEYLEDALVICQKILSCVVRLKEGYGGDYTSLALIGSRDQRILDAGHDKLSVYGLLSNYPRRLVRDWIEQLVAQGFLAKRSEYNLLTVTESGWRVLRGIESPRLLKPAEKPERIKVSKAARESWEGADKGLFEELRILRRDIAQKRHVPAFIIFGDNTLRDMSRKRPSDINGFLDVNGVGRKKSIEFGELFLKTIKDYCHAHSLEMDIF